MTVVVEKAQTTDAAQDLPEKALAPWGLRAAAFSVDVLPGLAVVATLALTSFTLPARGVWWWVCLSVLGAVVLLVLVNRLLLPTITGWSLGRALFGIAVVRRDGTHISPWWLLLRDLAHLLDTAALLIGWLWPLWDPERRTFADMLTRTEVLRVIPHERPEKVRQWTAVALLTAATLCLDGTAVGYEVVYAEGPGYRQVSRRDFDTGSAHRRTDADLRPEDSAGKFRPRAVVDHRQISARIGRSTAGGGEGPSGHQ